MPMTIATLRDTMAFAFVMCFIGLASRCSPQQAPSPCAMLPTTRLPTVLRVRIAVVTRRDRTAAPLCEVGETEARGHAHGCVKLNVLGCIQLDAMRPSEELATSVHAG